MGRQEAREELRRPTELPTIEMPLNLDTAYVRPHTALDHHHFLATRIRQFWRSNRTLWPGITGSADLSRQPLKSLLDNFTLHDGLRWTHYFCLQRRIEYSALSPTAATVIHAILEPWPAHHLGLSRFRRREGAIPAHHTYEASSLHRSGLGSPLGQTTTRTHRHVVKTRVVQPVPG